MLLIYKRLRNQWEAVGVSMDTRRVRPDTLQSADCIVRDYQEVMPLAPRNRILEARHRRLR